MTFTVVGMQGRTNFGGMGWNGVTRYSPATDVHMDLVDGARARAEGNLARLLHPPKAHVFA